MNMRYDKKVDAMYIELSKGVYKKSRKITDAIVVDEDKKGNILGIEILDATEHIPDFNPTKLSITSAS